MKAKNEATMNHSDGLRAVLETCERLTDNLASQKKVIDGGNAELHSLKKTIDLSDAGQVARMTHLLTLETVGNDRRAYLLQEMPDSLGVLVTANREFASNTLQPRCRELERRALAKLEEKLKPHFPDADARRAAAMHSTEMMALAPIQAQVVIRDYGADGAVRQAKVLLESWQAVDAFEAAHLS